MAINFSSPSTSKVTIPFTGTNSLRSVSLLVKRYGAGGGSLQRFLSKWEGAATGEEFLIYWNNSSSQIEWQFSRGTANDQWGWTGSGASNTWMQIGIDWNTNSGSMQANLWMNGASVGSLIVAGSGTIDTNTDRILVGNRQDSIRNADADIAEVAVWDRRLSSAEWASLGKFVSPRRFPYLRKAYVDGLGGRALCANNGACIVSGTAAAVHPPVRR